jgi:hypothetical protein
MVSKNSVMVFGGTGRVGSYAVLFLARSPLIDKIWIVCRHSLDAAKTIKNNATIAAAIHETYPTIEILGHDLLDEESTRKMLKEQKPRIILNSAAMISLFPHFPRIKARQRELGYISGGAHFLPKDIGLLYPLMSAVKESGIEIQVVNLAAPDIASAVLDKVGLSPTLGAGTLDLTVQGIRQSVARKLGLSMKDVQIEMVAQHAVRRFPPDQVPYFLKIYIHGEDQTGRFQLHRLVSEAADTSGVETYDSPNTTNAPITAASAVRDILALLSEKETICHASGVTGLPGGCPVSISSSKVELRPPKGLTRGDLFKMNSEAMKIEGVETIEKDGTVILTEAEQKWVREALRLHWENIPFSRLKEMAQELIGAYENL